MSDHDHEEREHSVGSRWQAHASFQDSFGTTWTVRKDHDWSTTQLLVTFVPTDRTEPWSYGFVAPGDLAKLHAAIGTVLEQLGQTEGPTYEKSGHGKVSRSADELTIVEQTMDGMHGFVLWKGRTPYPVVYPTREQAEHAKSMVERDVMFEVIAETEAVLTDEHERQIDELR